MVKTKNIKNFKKKTHKKKSYRINTQKHKFNKNFAYISRKNKRKNKKRIKRNVINTRNGKFLTRSTCDDNNCVFDINEELIYESVLDNLTQFMNMDDSQPKSFTLNIGHTSIVDTKCWDKTSGGSSGAEIKLCPDVYSNLIYKGWIPLNIHPEGHALWYQMNESSNECTDAAREAKKAVEGVINKNCICCHPMISEFIANTIIMYYITKIKPSLRNNVAMPVALKLHRNKNGNLDFRMIMEKALFYTNVPTVICHDLLDLFNHYTEIISTAVADIPTTNKVRRMSAVLKADAAWWDTALARGLQKYIEIYEMLMTEYYFNHSDGKLANIFVMGKHNENLELKISDLDKAIVTIQETTYIPYHNKRKRPCSYTSECLHFGMIDDLKHILIDMYIVAFFYLKSDAAVKLHYSNSLDVLCQKIYEKSANDTNFPFENLPIKNNRLLKPVPNKKDYRIQYMIKLNKKNGKSYKDKIRFAHQVYEIS